MAVVLPVSKRALRTFPWIKSEAFAQSSLSTLLNLNPGDIIHIQNDKDRYYAYFDGLQSKAPVKIFSTESDDLCANFERALASAAHLRKKLNINSNAYRLFFSEADGFPGVIVDIYDDIAIVQLQSSSLTRYLNVFKRAVLKFVEVNNVVSKIADEPIKLDQNKIVWENDIFFEVNFQNSQKTGLYLDQRDNRKILRNFLSGGEAVLDLFCYVGAFGLNALKAGAERVVFVDESRKSLERLKRNLILNDIQNSPISIVENNVFTFLKEHKDDYDVIICDPPAFTRSKHHVTRAIAGYKALIKGCLKLLKRGGFMLIFSCSHHVTIDIIEKILIVEAKKAGRHDIKILNYLFQSPDHPYLLGFPPSLYLKGLFAQIL